MAPRAWLPRVRHLLGRLPDAEVAARAGVLPYTVASTRRKLGIPAARSRDLASFEPAEVLRQVRARIKSRQGAPIGHLASLCRYHFGGWRDAVMAAGSKPTGKHAPPTPRPLTDALLRGTKTAAELERITGVLRTTIRYRRRQLGIDRDERRDWLASVRDILGTVPDTEVANRADVTSGAVFHARRRLGIARCPKPSTATTTRQ